MNKAILLGNLTKDPELRTTANGTVCASFVVACTRSYKNAEGKREADFVPCVAWRERGEFVSKYFRKGSRIAVEGAIRTGSYEKDGERHFTWEVVCDNVEFASSKSDGGGAGNQKPAQVKPDDNDPFAGDVDEDFVPLADSELPF